MKNDTLYNLAQGIIMKKLRNLFSFIERPRTMKFWTIQSENVDNIILNNGE